MRQIHGLYGITVDNDLRVIDNVTAALKGGCQIIQYRDKSREASEKINIALQLKSVCEQYDAVLIINDDVDLALACNADGVHVGKEDAAVQQARAKLPNAIVGVSCYNQLDRALKAQENGASYVAFGRFFSSKTKPDAVQANPELLRVAKAQLSIPIVAIGGITMNNAESLIEAGADSIAVIQGLFVQNNIESVAARFSKLFHDPDR